MRVTTGYMRRAVVAWLTAEGATRLQTLQLLDAVYAGTISGEHYRGDRRDTGADSMRACKAVRASGTSEFDSTSRRSADEGGYHCACLLGTLERIGCSRAPIEGVVAETFALALKIKFGDTPATSPWANAAADGIADYYAAQGW